MPIHQLIINAIINNKTLTLTDLEQRATARGITLDELYDALERVHRDKRIKRTTRGDEVVYTYAPPTVKEPLSHITWLNDNYIRPHRCEHGIEYTGCQRCKPFPEISYRHLFLSPTELLEYRAKMKGTWRGVKTRYKKPS